MRTVFHRLLITIACIAFGPASLAARPLGSHQAEPIIASPVSSTSPVGVPFIRNTGGPGISPGIAISAPIAFGAAWGDVFAGLGGNYDSGDLDGSGYLGMGFGDADKWVGLEANLNLISVSDSLSEAYSFNFKLHRKLGKKTAIAIGTEHQGRNGTALPDQSYEYLALSHIFTLNADTPAKMMTAPITVGIGNGRFSDLEPISRRYSDDTELFIAGGLLPHPKVSILAEWIGGQLNAGMSYTPFRRAPLVITAALLDVTEEYDDKPDFGLGVGYSFRFGQ